MAAEPADRRPQLGELLLRKGLVTEAQLERALEEQGQTRAPLGEILVELGFASKPTMANALAEQHGGPLRTEYGLALGPTPIPDPALESVPTGAPANGVPTESRREQESLRLALEQHQLDQVELATARASIEALRAELAEATGERAQHAARAERLAHQLAATQAEPDVLALALREQDELRLVVEQQRVELATARASLETLRTELAGAHAEQTRLDARVEELEQERPRPVEAAEDEPKEHLLFLPGRKGYAILARSGPVPGIGTAVEVPTDGGAILLTVLKLGASPLTGERGRCAYLA